MGMTSSLAAEGVNIVADGRRHGRPAAQKSGAGRTSLTREAINSYKTLQASIAFAKEESTITMSLIQRRKNGKFGLVIISIYLMVEEMEQTWESRGERLDRNPI